MWSYSISVGKRMRIILGVTGGIAAYKSILLLRLLKQAGHEVQVVLTSGAKQFVSPLTLQALSSRPVRDELFDLAQENAMGHIELARWAEEIVVAPATADFMARLRAGMANDLLTTLCLATEAPIALAPAMNRIMWSNPATQENVAVLQARGIHILPPESGEQACGEVGEGRMMAPEAIFSALLGESGLFLSAQKKQFSQKGGDPSWWQNKKVILTAGPTVETLDPVRYLANRSSGTMGYALAEALAEAGAEVTLVSGPVTLKVPMGVQRVEVETAQEMLAAVEQALPADVFIGAAAVADWRAAYPAKQKLKKQAGQERLVLELVRNPDILATVARHTQRPALVIGFAAETERLKAYARKKLAEKGADIIAANEVGRNKGFGARKNALWLLHRDGREVCLPLQDKRTLADRMIQQIAQWSCDET